jgi:hypothetical protein
MADVRTEAALSLFTDVDDVSELAPGPHQETALSTLVDEVIAWSTAPSPLRD